MWIIERWEDQLRGSPLPHLDAPLSLTVWDLKFITHPDRNVDSADAVHKGVTHRLLWQEHETFGVVSRHPCAILHHADIVLIPVLPEKIKPCYSCTNELNVCLRLGNRINKRCWIKGSAFWHTAVWLLKMNLDIYLRVSEEVVQETNQPERVKKLKMRWFNRSQARKQAHSNWQSVLGLHKRSANNGCVSTLLWKEPPSQNSSTLTTFFSV